MVRTATYLTLSQAATEAGKSKSVIHKALKDGTMSAAGKDDSGYKIDPAELFRVFPKNGVLEREKERSRTAENALKNAPENGSYISTLEVENKLLHARIIDKDERIGELKAEREDVQRERDRWHETANKLLLTYQPVEKAPEKPVQTDLESSGGVGETRTEKGAKNANLLGYGLFALILLGVTAGMNYFQADLRTFIDRELLGRVSAVDANPPEPAENAEKGREERQKEPRQSFPPWVQEPF